MSELPLILVIEDGTPLQGIVEEALREGGFETDILNSGSYEVDGDRFTATVTTRRHPAGHPTVFGVDEVELKLVGTSNGTIVTCSGIVDKLPGIVFRGNANPQPRAATRARATTNEI